MRYKDAPAEAILQTLELAHAARLADQKANCREFISRVERRLRKSPRSLDRYSYELQMIDRMKLYAELHAFLPESYKEMLLTWYYEAKANTKTL